MTTLYKIDSKGKTRVLNVYTEGADLVQTAGILGGNLVENRKTCKPKNVGKSNESTAEQQALSEMESKIAEKLKEDYFRTLEEAQNTEVILPMLAHSYEDHAKKITWELNHTFVQPKLDGMRALGYTGPDAKLVSRTGSLIETMPHIIDALKQLPAGTILDGELYAHGKTFQENMKLIKKYRGPESEEVKYHVYDAVSKEPFIERVYAMLFFAQSKHVEIVPTIPVKDFEVLKKIHAENIKEGYEGTMIRWGNAPYKVNGRSEHLLKYKDFKDMTLTVIDVVPSEQRPEWGQPVFELNGKRFSSGMRYSHEERKDWLLNKQNYIGKTAELRFFEFTDDGLPRFPVCCGLRLDK